LTAEPINGIRKAASVAAASNIVRLFPGFMPTRSPA
jgi:hypothetical protein